jgi:hypothetical protein
VAVLVCALLAAGCGKSHGGEGTGAPRRPESFVVGGIRLGTSPQPLVLRACRDAQREVSIRVVCPGLVPEGPLLKIAGLWGGFGFDRYLWLITFNNGDNGPKYLHWIMGAGRRSAVDHFLLTDAVNDVKGPPKKIGQSEVGSRTVLTYRYPPHPAGGPNGGHVAVYVSCGEEFVFASLHGAHRAASEKLALALADKAGCP